MSHLLPPRLTEDAEAIEATTTFHGDEEVDYRGRSWTTPPAGVKKCQNFCETLKFLSFLSPIQTLTIS